MRSIRYGLFLALAVTWLSAPPSAADGRVPIYAAGTVISQPGHYVLTRNLLSTGATPGVEIAAPRVELDLNGFTIDANGNRGVLVSFGNDVKIRNGAITGADVGVEIPGLGGGHAVIEDLRITGPSSAGIRAIGLETIAIRRVLVHLSTGDGIRIDGGGGLVQTRIEGCQIERVSGIGIAIVGARGIGVVDNLVGVVSGEGIRIDSATGGEIRGNRVTAAGGTGGIAVVSARGMTIAANVVAECRSHGIRVGATSSEIHLLENFSTLNGSGPGWGDGIRLEGLSAIVDGNVVTGNNGLGLHLAASGGYHTLGRNRASGNQNLAGQACGGAPALFPPNSCNDGVGGFTTFGDNLIPGPPLF
jgi:parallel beta-helix repeat protein